MQIELIEIQGTLFHRVLTEGKCFLLRALVNDNGVYWEDVEGNRSEEVQTIGRMIENKEM